MQKLTLGIGALKVESFRTQAEPVTPGQGTIHAHAANTQQVRCTCFCTYACTGLPC
jgi:hypothetical protein